MTKTMEMEKVCGVYQAELVTPPTPPPKPAPKLNLPEPKPTPKLNLPGYNPATGQVDLFELINMLEKQLNEQAEMIVKLSKSRQKQKDKVHILKSRCKYLEQTFLDLGNQDSVPIPMSE